MLDVDVIIVGGGVVGLSCAWELAQRGRSCAVLERHARFGEETSTHNSGVIHAGIYYEPGSLKARLCVEGRRMLVERLPAWRVPHRFGGKLIVATEPVELPLLDGLLAKGRANGVEFLEPIDGTTARRREPNVRAVGALLSAGTGVMDVGEYLHQLAGRAQAAGALLVAGAAVEGVDVSSDGVAVATVAKGRLTGRVLVNAAGLWADEIARMCGDDRHTIYPCRGEYAAVVPRRADLINNLVYPVPAKISLGVHLTRTVDGELWIGPDAKFVDAKDDYETNRRPVADFLESAQRLCPALELSDLRLGQSGIRPKRYGPGQPVRDYLIQRQSDQPHVLHLIGIESPGLTASPAIARHVADMLDDVD